MIERTILIKVELRPVSESDLATLFEFQREPEANAMAAFPARDQEAFMGHWQKLLADASCIASVVVVDGNVAGHLGSWTQDGERLVGYWLGRDFWGVGVATAALAQFLRSYPERPLHAYVVRHNLASIRVLEKCGFVHSATENDELIYVLNDNETNVR